jgi:hypothetical protein
MGRVGLQRWPRLPEMANLCAWPSLGPPGHLWGDAPWRATNPRDGQLRARGPPWGRLALHGDAGYRVPAKLGTMLPEGVSVRLDSMADRLSVLPGTRPDYDPESFCTLATATVCRRRVEMTDWTAERDAPARVRPLRSGPDRGSLVRGRLQLSPGSFAAPLGSNPRGLTLRDALA